MSAFFKKSAREARAFRIAPNDTNYFVLLFDEAGEGTQQVCVVEIFTVGGRTPPNSHVAADELFFVLSGEGMAWCNGESTPLRQGDALLVRPGAEHVVENTGPNKLYTLTVMCPNEGFAELIRAGQPVELDDEDRAVLGG
ncbi:cupin domain-containing protein [Roseomonas sp. BN140053]|uniref:cupin domain-containing protein n=1 Tax=Roseomonas sp. BN140053 TaxID=3391898 RepID=UPI0039EADBF7